MSLRSYLWLRAQVCLSRARVTRDPVLKELYEDMAVDFAHNAARERDLDSLKTSDWEKMAGISHRPSSPAVRRLTLGSDE
jgi:hypothetical protein